MFVHMHVYIYTLCDSPAPPLTWLLFGFVLICLIANSWMESREIVLALRKFEFLDYISDPFNMIDLSHLLLMWGMVAHHTHTNTHTHT